MQAAGGEPGLEVGAELREGEVLGDHVRDLLGQIAGLQVTGRVDCFVTALPVCPDVEWLSG